MSTAFFHKGISRSQAETLLLHAKDNGSFLVRDSETLPGAYVLCLLYNGKLHQYRVLPDENNQIAVQSENEKLETRYSCIDALIDAYVGRGEKNGLVCGLRKPVPSFSQEKDEQSESDEDDGSGGRHFISNREPAKLPHSYENIDRRKESDPNPVSEILQNFQMLDLSRFDTEFVLLLQRYLEVGAEVDSNAKSDGSLPEFKKMLGVITAKLNCELDSFQSKLDLLKQLFSQDGCPSPRIRFPGNPLTGDVSIVNKLGMCKTDTELIESKLLNLLAGGYSSLSEEPVKPKPSVQQRHPSQDKSLYIPKTNFQVRAIKHGKVQANNITLTVDINGGKFLAINANQEVIDSKKNIVSFDKILQLIKSTKDNKVLDILLDGVKNVTYQFNSIHDRENFCLQILQMKNIHSMDTDVDQISVFVGTWNMGDSVPDNSLNKWLKCVGSGKSRDSKVFGRIAHDVYVIGTQESACADKDWINRLKASFIASVMTEMELVDICSMWSIRIVIFIKPEHRNKISRVQKCSVKTGIANALGNKGAAALSFNFDGTSFCFINAHLASGEERTERRNQDYLNIVKGLNIGEKKLSMFDVTNKFHHVFWFGDLNYRVSDDITVILKKVQERDLEFLKERDQLKKEMIGMRSFYEFREGEINFLPTYRLERNREGYFYDWKKIKKTTERINAPSWCDRILWKSYPGCFIENIAYGAVDNILSSDHRPVFGSFSVGITSQFASNKASISDSASISIIFEQIEAEIKTCCKQYFMLEFHSPCLSESTFSDPNTKFIDNVTGVITCPKWMKNQIPVLKPHFGDVEYLEEQHILIAVVSTDGERDVFGGCVISLKDIVSIEPIPFDCKLTYQGTYTGKLRGKVHILLGGHGSSQISRQSKKTYELVLMDTEYHDPELYVPDCPNFSRRKDLTHTLSLQASKSGLEVPKDFNKIDRQVSADLMSFSTQPEYNKLFTLASSSQEQNDGDYTQIELDTVEEKPQSPSIKSPPVPSRRMKLGQSSLQANQHQVLPVVSPTCTDKNIIDDMTGSVSPKPLTSSAITNNSFSASPIPTRPRVPPPPIPLKSKPAPTHALPDPEKRYDCLTPPKTVDEWLTGIGLLQYSKNFLHNGWDSISYMGNMSNKDLVLMDIINWEHRQRILNSISELAL